MHDFFFNSLFLFFSFLFLHAHKFVSYKVIQVILALNIYTPLLFANDVSLDNEESRSRTIHDH